MNSHVRQTVALLLSVLIIAMVAGSVFGRSYSGGGQGTPFIIEGLVAVQLSDGVSPVMPGSAYKKVNFGLSSLDSILTYHQLESARKVFPWRIEKPAAGSGMNDLSKYYELRFHTGTDITQVIEHLLKDPGIIMAEPVWAMPVEAIMPNDPSAGNQWYLSVAALTSAWEIETGSDSVKIAIIDTGVNYEHPDLEFGIWVNPGEDIDGDMVVYDTDDLNGIDDDGNGVIDDVVGYDFFTGISGGVWTGEDAGTPDTDPNDFNGHGTHCAGIAAAVTNNNTGATGAAGGWYGDHPARSRGVRVMCLRVGATGSDGFGYVNTLNCATAIDYATLMGAKVINCSWGGSTALTSALQNAINADVTVVHAAGNDNSETGDYLDLGSYGAAISVAATRSDDRKAWFSNFGYWVDVSAPGQSIYSTVSYDYTPGYDYYDGTSMSAPLVTGLAALIRSMMPSLSRAEVDSIIVNTTDNIDAENPSYIGQLGSGRINFYSALAGLANARFDSDVTEGNVPLTVNFTDLSPNAPTDWTWSFGDGDSAEIQNPTHIYDQPGIHTVSLIIDEPNGQGEEHMKNLIWVQADTLTIGQVAGYAGEEVIVPVYLTSTALIKEIAFSFTVENEAGFTLQGASVEGLRTEEWFKVQMTGYGGNRREYTLKPLTTGSTIYLPPGEGPMLNLIINIPEEAEVGATLTIDTLTWIAGAPNISTIWGDYWPEYAPGGVEVIDCCGRYTSGFTGNVNCSEDGLITLSDITRLIDKVYVSQEPLCCRTSGNTNGGADGIISLSDITRLIDHVYISKGIPAPCQ